MHLCVRKGLCLFRQHPDWLLKVNGAPWCCGCNWSSFYALDIDNPAVLDYLRRVFDRVLNDWGFDLVKLDFLYGAAPFGNARESRAARMYRAMELLRTWCGQKQILGCGVPVMPAFGLVDYCRVSCDVGLDWDVCGICACSIGSGCPQSRPLTTRYSGGSSMAVPMAATRMCSSSGRKTAS